MTFTISHFLEGTRPEGVLFWSGAGISIDPPCQEPSGDTLTRRVLDQLFEGGTEQRIAKAYGQLNITSGNGIRSLPRLETVLDVAVAEHGLDVLPVILRDLDVPHPNSLHQFFADHVSVGGHHVTVNFDTQIEAAGGNPDRIVHVHGVVGDWEKLGARLSVIERGIQGELRDRLRTLISQCKAVVFVGYGGRDYFDVDPFLRGAAAEGLFADKVVLWLDHLGDASSAPWSHRQTEWFAMGDADVRVVRVNTIRAMAEFANAWSIPQPEDPPARAERTAPQVRLKDEQRQRATTRLYAVMGLHGDVKSRLVGRTLDQEEEKWAAQAAWAAGQYGEYAAHWRRAVPGDDDESWAVRCMHDGAALWLRGQLRLARRNLLAAVEEAERRKVSPEQRLELVETLGRVLQHMSMLPDTHLLVTRTWRRRVLTHLDRAEAEATTNLGIHLRNRVEDVRLWLKGEDHDDKAQDHVQDFNEAEALNAMLNFRHGELRKLTAEVQRPSAIEYTSLAEHFRYIGARGDAVRVPVLPGATSAFKWRDVRSGFGEVDFTFWHRARLEAGWLVLSVYDRLKRQRKHDLRTVS